MFICYAIQGKDKLDYYDNNYHIYDSGGNCMGHDCSNVSSRHKYTLRTSSVFWYHSIAECVVKIASLLWNTDYTIHIQLHTTTLHTHIECVYRIRFCFYACKHFKRTIFPHSVSDERGWIMNTINNTVISDDRKCRSQNLYFDFVCFCATPFIQKNGDVTHPYTEREISSYTVQITTNEMTIKCWAKSYSFNIHQKHFQGLSPH